MVTLFKKQPNFFFPKWFIPFYSLTSNAWMLQFLHILTNILTGIKWCVIVVFIRISLKINECWASFHVLIGHLYVFFGEMCIQKFCLLFNLVAFLLLSYKSFHTFWTLSFARNTICKYFFLVCGLSFQFLNVLWSIKVFNF